MERLITAVPYQNYILLFYESGNVIKMSISDVSNAVRYEKLDNYPRVF